MLKLITPSNESCPLWTVLKLSESCRPTTWSKAIVTQNPQRGEQSLTLDDITTQFMSNKTCCTSNVYQRAPCQHVTLLGRCFVFWWNEGSVAQVRLGHWALRLEWKGRREGASWYGLALRVEIKVYQNKLQCEGGCPPGEAQQKLSRPVLKYWRAQRNGWRKKLIQKSRLFEAIAATGLTGDYYFKHTGFAYLCDFVDHQITFYSKINAEN